MKNNMGRNRLGALAGFFGGAFLSVSWMPSHAQEPAVVDESEVLFEQGMEALEADRLRSAMKSFQSILSQQPGLHRARLELALAYYRALDYAEARAAAQAVLDDPLTPPEVRVTVLAFLAQVNRDEAAFAVRHEFKPSISLGLMYDSNVNVGPSTDIIEELPGATLTDPSLELSDNAVVMTAGIAHRYQPGKTYPAGEQTAAFLWQSQANLYNRAYSSEDEFDLTVATASTGPAWIVLRHWRTSMMLNVDRIWLGGDELAWFYSLNPAVTWQFNNGELTWDATFTKRRYDDEVFDSGREGTYKATGLSLGHYFNQRKVAGQLGARLIDFGAEDDQYGHDGYELLAGVIIEAWPGGSLYGRANFRDVQYDGVAAGFPVARDEQERRLAAGFQHDFRSGRLDRWVLSGGIQYTDNDSNISIYDYDRRQVTINLGRTF